MTQAAWRGDDFPSWLSPMVVKELRQGVQSGAFAWTFIGLQMVMFLLMTWALTAFNAGGGWQGGLKQVANAMFWLVVAAAVVLVVPLRGLSAISSERMGNNLDLVRLTRLSATWIVIGKWLAIIAQGALVVMAILPYIVLRYFFGGVNVVGDMETSGWLLAASMLVTAAAIALSTQPLWVRIGAGLVSVFVILAGMAGLSSRFVTFGVAERMGILAAIALYTAVLLEYAAARIAPVAENHALRKRSIGCAMGVAWLIVGSVASERVLGATFLVMLPLLLVYAIEALLENPVHVRSQAIAFARWGLAGRAAARVLLPGWATGLNFVLILVATCGTGLLMVVQRFSPPEFRAMVVTIVALASAVIVFPLPLLVYATRVRHRLLLYALVQLVCFLVFVYAEAMRPHDRASGDVAWGMLPFPLAALASWLGSPLETQRSPAFLIAAVMVIVIVLASVAWPWWREMCATGRLLAACRSRPGLAGGRAGAAA